MKKLTAIWDIKDGVVHVVHRDKFKDAVKNLPNGRYICIIEKAYRKRSNNQNATFWAIAYRIIQEALEDTTGEKVTPEFVHELCKDKCLPPDYVEQLKEDHENKEPELINEETGEVYKSPFRLTTTKMTTTQAMEYYRNMQEFGREWLGCDIPEPAPNYKNEADET